MVAPIHGTHFGARRPRPDSLGRDFWTQRFGCPMASHLSPVPREPVTQKIFTSIQMPSNGGRKGLSYLCGRNMQYIDERPIAKIGEVCQQCIVQWSRASHAVVNENTIIAENILKMERNVRASVDSYLAKSYLLNLPSVLRRIFWWFPWFCRHFL